MCKKTSYYTEICWYTLEYTAVQWNMLAYIGMHWCMLEYIRFIKPSILVGLFHKTPTKSVFMNLHSFETGCSKTINFRGHFTKFPPKISVYIFITDRLFPEDIHFSGPVCEMSYHKISEYRSIVIWKINYLKCIPCWFCFVSYMWAKPLLDI